MPVEIDLAPIVEARALQCPIVHAKTGHSYDVQGSKRRRTKPGDVAGVGRYLGFIKGDVHQKVVIRLPDVTVNDCIFSAIPLINKFGF